MGFNSAFKGLIVGFGNWLVPLILGAPDIAYPRIKSVKIFGIRPTFKYYLAFFLLWRYDPTLVMAFSFLRFLDHTQRRTTVGRTPLDE
jgi:heme/copper-type cytochrome/quinol oxidase subunit 1